MGIQEWDQLAPQYFSLGCAVEQPGTQSLLRRDHARTAGSPDHHARPIAASLSAVSGSVEPQRKLRQFELSRHAGARRAPLVEGLSILAPTRVSKEIDDMIPSVNGFPGESFSGAPPQNFYNLRGERALASWDTPQTLVLSYVYEFPFGPGKPFLNGGGVLGKIFGGWQINGNTTFQSGFPVQINGGNGSGSFAGTQRPNWNGKNADAERPRDGPPAALFRYVGLLFQRAVHVRQRSAHDAESALSGRRQLRHVACSRTRRSTRRFACNSGPKRSTPSTAYSSAFPIRASTQLRSA